jgi:tetratricopeptide (TPR) repeat protein
MSESPEELPMHTLQSTSSQNEAPEELRVQAPLPETSPAVEVATAEPELQAEEQTAPAPGSDRRIWLMALLPALLAVAAFLPVLDNAFLEWDDFANFVNNRAYRGLGWEQLRWDWTTLHRGVYQPLGWMLLSAESLASGLQPRGYHLTSLLLHAACAVALYALTVALLGRCFAGRVCPSRRMIHVASAAAVALFVVHPLRTEVVAWVSCQPYLPCALCAMLAVLAYLHAHPEGQPTRRGWVLLAFLLFAAALLFKAAALGLPLVLLILDAYPLRRLGRGGRKGPPSESESESESESGPVPGPGSASSVGWVVLEKLPFVALSLGFAVVAMRVREPVYFPPRIDLDGIDSRLAQACYGTWFYLIKTLVPWNLTAYYPMPDRIAWSNRWFAMSGLAVLGVTVVLLALRRQWPGLLAAWAAYLVLLAPDSGLTPIGPVLAADRYSYLATLGLVVLLAAGLAALIGGPARRLRGAGLAVVVVGVVGGLMALSTRQCRTWRDTTTLWRHALAHTARPTPEMSMYLGLAVAASEGPAAALPYLRRAVALGPDDPGAHFNLASNLFSSGQLAQAGDEFAAAARLKEDFFEARLMLGRSRFLQGRRQEAIDQLRRAVTLRPDDVETRRALGGMLFYQGLYEGASQEFARVAKLRPDDPEAHYQMGVALLRQHRLDAAADQFAAALRLRPDYAEAINDLGALRAEQGRIKEAAEGFATALKLKPEHADAHYNTALLYIREQRYDRAEEHLARALKSRPGHASAARALDSLRRIKARSPKP